MMSQNEYFESKPSIMPLTDLVIVLSERSPIWRDFPERLKKPVK
jgi:hypothetical protein